MNSLQLIFLEQLFKTNSKILTETIIKTRSGSDEDDFDESLQLLLEKMVNEKIILLEG